MNNPTNTDKCSHEACKCSVQPDGPFGKFCSQHCQDTHDVAELECDCGHPGCKL